MVEGRGAYSLDERALDGVELAGGLVGLRRRVRHDDKEVGW